MSDAPERQMGDLNPPSPEEAVSVIDDE